MTMNYTRRVEGHTPVYEPTFLIKARLDVLIVHGHLKVVDNDFGDVLKFSRRLAVEDRRFDDGPDGNNEGKD